MSATANEPYKSGRSTITPLKITIIEAIANTSENKLFRDNEKRFDKFFNIQSSGLIKSSHKRFVSRSHCHINYLPLQKKVIKYFDDVNAFSRYFCSIE